MLHEANESYIGGQKFPGQPYTLATFNAARTATLAIDPPQGHVKGHDVHNPTTGLAEVGLKGPLGSTVLYKVSPATGKIVK